MTTLPASLTALAPNPRFAWRAPTAQHWRLALTGGAAFGIVYAVANAMFGQAFARTELISDFALCLILATFLLVCNAGADSLRIEAVPRWLVFAVAGLFASVAACFVTLVLLGQLVFGASESTSFALLWVFWPPIAITAVLASLGYMNWSDAGRQAERLHALRVDHVRATREAYEARLSALQARVEPEFLFGTLADVEKRYETDPPAAADMLDNLIVHLRAALPTIEQVTSSLGNEITLVESWLDVMSIRRDRRLTVALAKHDAPRHARMPPMVLLPLVQHAVEAGGLEPSAVVVTTAVDGERLFITVVGPRAAFSAAATAGRVVQIRERIEALYGDSARLTLESIAHERSQATLEVPHEPTDRCPR